MARMKSNLPSVLASGRAVANALNFRAVASTGRRFGDEAADVMAVGIQQRTRDQQFDVEGRPLPRLAESTIRRKRAAGRSLKILVETGEMLSLDQIEGEKNITTNMCEVRVGGDEEIRDRVGYAEEGGPNRPERHFVGIDGRTEGRLDVLAEETIEHTIRRNGGS